MIKYLGQQQQQCHISLMLHECYLEKRRGEMVAELRVSPLDVTGGAERGVFSTSELCRVSRQSVCVCCVVSSGRQKQQQQQQH